MMATKYEWSYEHTKGDFYGEVIRFLLSQEWRFMFIQKIGHSCLLLKEQGKRLLIDPGAWAFAPIGIMQPEDVGSVDVVLFTHEHADHFDPAIIRRIAVARAPKIYSHARIGELLVKEGIACEAMAAGAEVTAEGFRIRGIAAPHGEIPSGAPANLGYLVNSTLFHPGDSITFTNVSCAIYAMPLAAPWLRMVDTLAVAATLKPKIVIPIHDAYVKDFFLERMHATAKTYLEAKGVAMRSPKPGESIEA